jgi:superfamily II DNA or RNA helicase
MIGDLPSDAELVGEHVRVPRHFMDAPEPVEVITPTWDRLPIESKTVLRPQQVDALAAMVDAEHGILNLGCGHGKTVIALNYIASQGVKAIVIVNRTNLISQWRDEALLHLDITRDKIGTVQGNRWEYEGKYIVIASINTLASRYDSLPGGFADSFGVVIFDECHHLSAPMFRKVCPMFSGKRHGLSATPKREDGYERAFMYHLGKVYFSNISQELVPDVVFVKTNLEEDHVSDDAKDVTGEIHHRKLCAWLGSVPIRNQLILEIVQSMLSAGHKVLCLTHSVDHAKFLNATVKDSGLACGDVDASSRKDEIASHSVSFATIDVAAEALNVPELSCLILATPFGARTHGNILQQALGRIQRKHETKLHPIAIFINDFGIHMCSALMRQCKKRLSEWDYPYREQDATNYLRELQGLHKV